jgi:hypothetical protein
MLLLVLFGSLVAAVLTPTGARAAQAAPKPTPKPTPMSITITGEDFGEPLVVRSEVDGPLFAAVLDQVSWLRGDGQGKAPDAAALGRRYTLVVHVGDAARQTFDLYPLAEGGPRAYRPSEQPGQSTTAAWFYGRLNMSETLRAAGVPLPEQDDTVSGGIGGGERVNPVRDLGAAQGIDEILRELRRALLFNAGVVLTITAGLAGIALLVRHRTTEPAGRPVRRPRPR